MSDAFEVGTISRKGFLGRMAAGAAAVLFGWNARLAAQEPAKWWALEERIDSDARYAITGTIRRGEGVFYLNGVRMEPQRSVPLSASSDIGSNVIVSALVPLREGDRLELRTDRETEAALNLWAYRDEGDVSSVWITDRSGRTLRQRAA